MAKLSTRGNYWILAWTEAGKRHRISLGRTDTLPRRDAEACLKVKQYELSTGARILNANRRPAPRLADYLKDYLLWHRMEYPASHYRVEQIAFDHLQPRFGLTPLNLITPAEVEQWKNERRFVAKASTVGKEIRVFQAMMNRAVALKIITDNPISIVSAPRILDSKPHRFYEAPELQLLYAGSSYGPIWRLMANTGLRRGEALMLRWLWIRETTVRILSAEDERTKSGKWRDIPMSDGAREALQGMKRDGPYILPRIQPESLSRAFAKDAGRAGLDGTLHTLRHTYISHLVRSGVPLRTVQMYAGHAHMTTTEKYAYLDPGSAPEQALKLAI